MYPTAIGQRSSPRIEKPRLTAGLKCAPEIGPKVNMSTARMAPVGMVLQRRASATLPPASFCAMMPEPTTAAKRNAVPSHSANRRSAASASMGFRDLGCRAFHLSDLAELALQAERVDGPKRQRGKDSNTLVEHAISI